MAVEFQEGNHVDVAFAPVSDDAFHLLFRKTAAGIEQRITVELDASFAVKVVLIGFPAREEIQLALDLVFRGKLPVTHVDHGSAVGERRPIADLDFRQDRVALAAFDQLSQRLHRIEQPRR